MNNNGIESHTRKRIVYMIVVSTTTVSTTSITTTILPASNYSYTCDILSITGNVVSRNFTRNYTGQHRRLDISPSCISLVHLLFVWCVLALSIALRAMTA